MDELIDGHLKEAIKAVGAIWQLSLSYEEKVVATMEFNRGRYLHFHKGNEIGGAPWSPSSRMRLEANLLSEKARLQLREFSNRMEQFVAAAIDQAQANGEIAADAPVRDIAVRIVCIINSAGSITLDAGSFTRLEHLYLAHMRVIAHAYVAKCKPKGVRKRALAAVGNG